MKKRLLDYIKEVEEEIPPPPEDEEETDLVDDGDDPVPPAEDRIEDEEKLNNYSAIMRQLQKIRKDVMNSDEPLNLKMDQEGKVLNTIKDIEDMLGQLKDSLAPKNKRLKEMNDKKGK